MEKQIFLRAVCMDDIQFVFNLVNDTVVRETAFTHQKITWATHSTWFEKQLKDNIPFFIIEQAGKACGYIRFQLQEDNANQWILTIAISEASRGKGIGKIAVVKACKKIFAETGIKKIVARVRHENIASAHLFLNSGFIEIDNADFREFYYAK